MASVDTGGGESSHKKGPGVKKAKKLSTRVDMTPMVDLGFLLITFFIFTATLSSPVAMDLNMPKDTEKVEEESKIKQSGALTILLGRGDQVYYYEGELLDANASEIFKQTTFKGIRDVIIKKKLEVIRDHKPEAKDEEIKQKAKAKGDKDWEKAALDRDFFVVIKPNAEATYKNTVDILDEMTINNVKRFAMVKISETEDKLVQATQK
jgi:biopolymer transport protein ExbD